jgi:hypothetical protein
LNGRNSISGSNSSNRRNDTLNNHNSNAASSSNNNINNNNNSNNSCSSSGDFMNGSSAISNIASKVKMNAISVIVLPLFIPYFHNFILPPLLAY